MARPDPKHYLNGFVFTLTDLQTWKDCRKGEWLTAKDLLPSNYRDKKKRIKRMVERQMCETRARKTIFGYWKEYFVDTEPHFLEAVE